MWSTFVALIEHQVWVDTTEALQRIENQVFGVIEQVFAAESHILVFACELCTGRCYL